MEKIVRVTNYFSDDQNKGYKEINDLLSEGW